MMKVADRFTDEDVVVVVLPDSGERYLSKIYDDDWMREYGFLVPEKVNARYVLERKPLAERRLISVAPGDPVKSALDLFREHDISQIPVLDGGRCVGSLHDHSLMLKIFEQPDLLSARVDSVMARPFPTVRCEAGIDDVLRLLSAKDQYAVLVVEEKGLVGILSRYDVIEFMGH
jgi:cystathionine beta-synthase